MRITFLALCTKTEPYINHQKAQEGTWANTKLNLYWLLGNHDQSSSYVLNDRFLSVKVNETFENILEKTLQSLRWALENEESDFYIRTNTSTYINVHSLEKYLEKVESWSEFAAALKGTTNEIRESSGEMFEFLAGNMMIFSRSTVKLLSEMDSRNYHGISDDVAISEYLQKKGVKLTWISRNEITDYHGFKPNIQHRVKSWTSASVTAERMYEVHEIYTRFRWQRFRAILSMSVKEMSRYKTEFRIDSPINVMRNINNTIRILTSVAKCLPFILSPK